MAQTSARNMHLVEDSVSLVLDAQVLDTPETGRDRSVYRDWCGMDVFAFPSSRPPWTVLLPRWPLLLKANAKCANAEITPAPSNSAGPVDSSSDPPSPSDTNEGQFWK